jgi:hypothetical protein
VFERERHSNGRDDAFLRPDASELLARAEALRAAGVRRLLVVVPHAPALLPHALKAGFASRDEGAVAALGFEHLVFVRAAQTAGAADGGSASSVSPPGGWRSCAGWCRRPTSRCGRSGWPNWWCNWLRRLPGAPQGTRVLPPEVLQQAAQADDAALALDRWLALPRP